MVMIAAQVNTPGIHEITRLMDTYGMLNNIRHHSLVVARVADQLYQGLMAGPSEQVLPDYKLVISGALLHDIAKTLCLNNSCDHAEIGAEICQHHGYPEVAEIVAEHVLLKANTKEKYRRGAFRAKDIVYYADKRVRHQRVVNLTDRLEYILLRYGTGNSFRHRMIRQNFKECESLEKYLFHFIPFSPENLGTSPTISLSGHDGSKTPEK